MEAINVTTVFAAKCLAILKDAAEPIVAADMAAKLFMSGSRESQRRHVRAIVDHLRKEGSMIVASIAEGYWLTEDLDIWKDYQEKRAVDGKKILAEVSRRKKAAGCGEKGQGLLFMPAAPNRYGVD